MDIVNILSALSDDASNNVPLEECRRALDTFNSENEKTFNFELINTNVYNRLLTVMCNKISGMHELSLQLLTLLRLLSRDKNLVTNTEDTPLVMNVIQTFYENVNLQWDCSKLECVKCLCNWVYHSESARIYLIEHNFFKTMIKNLNTSELNDKLFYQIRLIFLITALDKKERANMLEYGTLTLLLTVTELVIQQSAESKVEMEKTLTELLKAVFNIMFEISNVSSEQIKKDSKKLALLARSMLVTFYPYDHKAPNEVLTHIANILINLPNDASALLIPPVSDYGTMEIELPSKKYKTIYQGYDMTAILILLDALEQRINFTDYNLMKEKTLTILIAFSYVCRVNRNVRKFLKDGILPRLKTSSVRPEEQPGLRGKIIKLMQSVDIPLKNMAADFFFVLCKENTNRLVRYAGYGNCAGFLASRGLMIPGIPHAVEGDYSEDEDSDHSDDEEKDPITGATALPKEDYFANLTESEKEIEIDNLISMTNRLKELNVIKPMAVKSDGTLCNVDPNEQMDCARDSDSD